MEDEKSRSRITWVSATRTLPVECGRQRITKILSEMSQFRNPKSSNRMWKEEGRKRKVENREKTLGNSTVPQPEVRQHDVEGKKWKGKNREKDLVNATVPLPEIRKIDGLKNIQMRSMVRKYWCEKQKSQNDMLKKSQTRNP